MGSLDSLLIIIGQGETVETLAKRRLQAGGHLLIILSAQNPVEREGREPRRLQSIASSTQQKPQLANRISAEVRKISAITSSSVLFTGTGIIHAERHSPLSDDGLWRAMSEGRNQMRSQTESF